MENKADFEKLLNAQLLAANSEEKLKAILKAIPDFLFNLDGIGKSLSFYQSDNESLYKPSSEYVNNTLFDVFEPDLANNSKVNQSSFSSWKDGRYEFSNEDLAEVFNAIVRWWCDQKGQRCQAFFELINLSVLNSYKIDSDQIQINEKQVNQI